MPRWTPTDNAKAIADGWRIMHGQVVRNMARSELPNDDAARDWVALLARAGSALHRKALSVTKKNSWNGDLVVDV